MRASILGINLVVATFVGLAIGVFLDKKLGTQPWLTIIFLLLGIATGFRDLIKMAREAEEEAEEEDKRDSDDDKKPL